MEKLKLLQLLLILLVLKELRYFKKRKNFGCFNSFFMVQYLCLEEKVALKESTF